MSSSASSSSAALGASGRATAVPASDNEISATAQALLEAHRQRLRDHASPAADHGSVAERQTTLASLEQQISNYERLSLQLENLTVLGQPAASPTTNRSATASSAAASSTILQPFGPLAFWPATVANHQDVFVRQPSKADSESQAVRTAKLPPLTRVSSGQDRIRVEVMDEKLRRHTVEYVKKPIQQVISEFESKAASLKDQAASTRQGLISASNDTMRQKLKEALNDVEGLDSSSHPKDGIVVNEKNQVLNEEGLPFFEPIEAVPDSPPLRAADAGSIVDSGSGALPARAAKVQTRAPGLILPFRRSAEERESTREQRRKWMDDIFGKLETEEQQEEDLEDGDASEEEDDDDGGEAARNGRKGDKATAASLTGGVGSESELPPSPRSPTSENRVVLRRATPTPPESPVRSSHPPLPEISSATRPPPPKSALKQVPDRPSMSQRPSFGSSGVRHGFLNLNPSSPGAIMSSYAAEDLERQEREREQQRARQQPGGERLGRSLSTPSVKTVVGQSSAAPTAASSSASASGTSTPSKKSVRIQSPERFRGPPSSSSRQAGQDGRGSSGSDGDVGLSALQQALREVKKVNEKNVGRSGETASKRHADDVGVEEEAARIVGLLGPGIVEGHPGAPSKAVFDQMQRAFDEDKRAQMEGPVAERKRMEAEARQLEQQRRLAEKPALGHTVVERQPGAPADRVGSKPASDVQKAKQSAFKRGFLNQKPSFAPVNPPRARTAPAVAAAPPSSLPSGQVPPTQSLGMSALDRASLGDEDLSRRREQLGLPPAVPHARPSKAYAEKMAKRRQGLADGQGSDGSGQNAPEPQGEQLARPTGRDKEPREGRVRFAAPSAARDGDEASVEEERVNEINPSARDGVADEGHDEYEREADDDEAEIPIIRGEGADSDSDDGRPSSKRRASTRFSIEDGDGDDVESEYDDHEDDGYDTDDLMDLEPDMDYDVEAAFDDTELMKEYAKAKAVLQELGLAPGGSIGSQTGAPARIRADHDGAEEDRDAAAATADDDEDEDDYEDDIVPLDATVEDQEYQGNTTDGSKQKSKLSRFKADLASRSRPARSAADADAAADEAGHQLAHLLTHARNLGQANGSAGSTSEAFQLDGVQPPPAQEGMSPDGPIMIIPSLAPIKYAKNGDLIEGQARLGPVELVGAESDEEEDAKAEMTMRSRIERMDWKREHPEEAQRLREKAKADRGIREGTAPPAIGSSKDRTRIRTAIVPPGLAATSAAAVPAEASAAMEAIPATSDDATPPVVPAPNGLQGEEDGAAAAPTKPKKVSRFKAARMAG